MNIELATNISWSIFSLLSLLLIYKAISDKESLLFVFLFTFFSLILSFLLPFGSMYLLEYGTKIPIAVAGFMVVLLVPLFMFLFFIVLYTLGVKDLKSFMEKGMRYLVAPLIILFVSGAILNKLWLSSIGEEYISSPGMLALMLILLFFLFVIKAIFQPIEKSLKHPKVEKIKRNFRGIKKKRKKKKVSHVKKFSDYDVNYFSMYGSFFIAIVFLSFSVYYLGEVSYFWLAFCLAMGTGALVSAIYFYLSTEYFKKAILTITHEIKSKGKVRGYFILNRRIKEDTTFSLVLNNSYETTYMDEDDDGNDVERTSRETLWKVEKKGFIDREDEDLKISFSLPIESYTFGRLSIKVKAKTKRMTFFRTFNVGEK